MPLNINLNTFPFFDDFDQTKNYYRELFRPKIAVQARELNQIQSILQDQLEKFGNYAFKNGDVVSGCAISDIPNLPFIRLTDNQSNGTPYSIPSLINCYAVSTTSNLTAKVIYANSGLGLNYPNTMIVYYQYINVGNNGATVFANTDQLKFVAVTNSGNTTVAIINAYSNSAGQNTTGIAHGINATEGVIFINGTFVRVANSTIGLVNAYGNAAGNSVVGFQVSENIINEDEDPSILDNALGYSNYNAPGAYRLQIIPSLVSLDPIIAANTTGFNAIVHYSMNNIVSIATAPDIYSIINQAIAQRIYDEAGNYVVNPFVVDSVTNIGGVAASSNASVCVGRVSPGTGYAQGSRVSLLNTQYFGLRRGVDTKVNNEQQITFNYGGYFQCVEVAGSFDLDASETVQFYDAYQTAVTTRGFATVAPTGNNIGSANIRCYSYVTGNPGSNSAIYNIHVFNINLTSGYSVQNIKSLYFNGSTKGVADVLTPGLQQGSLSKQLFTFGVPGLKNLKDGSNNNNTEYVYRKKSTGTMASNGTVTFTLTSSAPGGVDILPYGIGVLPSVDVSTFSLISTANGATANLTGTVSVYNTQNNVLGSATAFTTDFIVGDLIKVGSDIRIVTSITNSTVLNVDSFFSANSSAQNYVKQYINGQMFNLNIGTRSINLTNSTSFTITSGQTPSAPLNIEIYYNVLRTATSPAQKVINKHRYVKIDTTTSNSTGPWCLGFSDIHKIRQVYGISNGTYTTSGVPIGNTSFVWDTGQKDSFYNLGYLYLKPGTSITPYPYLLVELDYFTTNTTPGLGFFTVESYPVDDANTANLSAIATSEIPIYVDSGGNQLALRDYIDFRVSSNSTANNTGPVDVSNTTQVTTAISYATVNPSNTLTLYATPTYGVNPPAWGANFQASYTNYLPRKDLVYMTPDNIIKVKEGVSAASPQTPLYPDSGMAIAVLNIPPYPSLTTDQVDTLARNNQTSRTIIRDTSLAILTNSVTQRGYTMKDIGKLDSRITDLEYYASLTLLQQQTSSLTITDENGLNRFKNGIFVDPFSDFSFCDVSNPEFSIAIDSRKGIARPRITREFIPTQYASWLSSNVQKTGRIISLPYTSVKFMDQPYATKYRSASLVAFAWNGNMVLMPPYDNNIDMINASSVNVTVDNTTAWLQFANTPYNSMYGDWQTSTGATDTSVISKSGGTLGLAQQQGFNGITGSGLPIAAFNVPIGTTPQMGLVSPVITPSIPNGGVGPGVLYTQGSFGYLSSSSSLFPFF